MYDGIEKWQEGAEERAIQQEQHHGHHHRLNPSKNNGVIGRKVGGGRILPSLLPNHNTTTATSSQPPPTPPRRAAPPATPLERWESLLHHAKTPHVTIIPTNRRGLDRDYVHDEVDLDVDHDDEDDSEDASSSTSSSVYHERDGINALNPAVMVTPTTTSTTKLPQQHSQQHGPYGSPLSPPISGGGGLGARSHTEAFTSADFTSAAVANTSHQQNSNSTITNSSSSSSILKMTKSGRSQKIASKQPEKMKYFCYTLELFAARCILTCLPTVASINLTPMLPSQGHILGRLTAGFRKQMQGWLEVINIHVLQQEADEFIAMVDEFVDIFRELEKPRHLRRRRGGGNRKGGAGDVPAGLPVLDANSAPFEVPSSESDCEAENNIITENGDEAAPSIRRRGATEILSARGEATTTVAPTTNISNKHLRKKKSPSPLVAIVDAAIDQFDAAERSMIKLLLVEDSLNVESVMRLRLQVLEHRAAMSLYIALSKKKQPSPTIVAGPGGEEITVANVRTGAGGAMLSKRGGALLLPHSSSSPPTWMINQAKAIPERRFYHDIFTPMEVLDREEDLFIRPSAAARRGLHSGLPSSSSSSQQQNRGGGQRKKRGVLLRADDLLGGDNGDIATIDPSRLNPFQINFDVTMKFYASTITGLGVGTQHPITKTNDTTTSSSPSPFSANVPDLPAHLTTTTMMSQLQHILKRIQKLPISSTYVDMSAVTGMMSVGGGHGVPSTSNDDATTSNDVPAGSTSTSTSVVVTLLDEAILRQASRAAAQLAFPTTNTTTTNLSTNTTTSPIPPFLTVATSHNNNGGSVASPRGVVAPPLPPLPLSGATNTTTPPPSLSALMGMRAAMMDMLQGRGANRSGGGGGGGSTSPTAKDKKKSSTFTGGSVGAAMLTFESGTWELYHLLVEAPPVAALHTLCATNPNTHTKMSDTVATVADALTNAYLPLTLLTHIFPLISPPASKAMMVPASRPGSSSSCLLYTSDAADEEDSVDLGGRRIIKKKKKKKKASKTNIRKKDVDEETLEEYTTGAY
eukprot:TRINITY_DN22395_c0_g1_i7.p1 TRINITY_DN22395_c0_g1~~TRINITY_DN22395_c0_g1_i7.p1  ORF type:complete len:1033 (+),score=212.34 TRINITY_DN22395_c0_g1_i7:574-3672(+)